MTITEYTKIVRGSSTLEASALVGSITRGGYIVNGNFYCCTGEGPTVRPISQVSELRIEK